MAQTIADPSTYSKVLDNAAQLHRLLEEAGLSSDARQRVINDPDFRAELVRFWNGTPASSATPVTPKQAAAIMGSNFIGIEAMQRHLGVKLSPKSKKLFNKVPYNTAVLQQCAETHVLVACGGLSLIDVWRVQPDNFYDKSSPWFGACTFSHTRTKAGWQLVRKQAVQWSKDKTWHEQVALLGEDEMVPSASILTQVILLYFLETNERLFLNAYVRTSDEVSVNARVYLSFFYEGGIFIDRKIDNSYGGGIGLSSSQRKIS